MEVIVSGGEQDDAFAGRRPGEWFRDELLDRVAEDDRRWFVAHPGEDVRVREAVDGEFPDAAFGRVPPGLEDAGELVRLVRVTQLAPGVRVREPFSFVTLPATTRECA